MKIKMVCRNRRLLWSFLIYLLENLRTLDEINRIIDEYRILLHSSISSSFIGMLSIEHISHSIIIEYFVESIIILVSSERRLNFNRIIGIEVIIEYR